MRLGFQASKPTESKVYALTSVLLLFSKEMILYKLCQIFEVNMSKMFYHYVLHFIATSFNSNSYIAWA